MKKFISQGFGNNAGTGYPDHYPGICNQQTTVRKSLSTFFIEFKADARKLVSSCKILPMFILAILNVSAIAAQQEINYALHANIIYRFTKYIDWPNDNTSDDFVIGIVGDTPLFETLKSFVVNKTVGNRKIVIKKMSSSEDVYSCHILFVSEEKSKSVKKIAEITKGNPVLIISENNSQALKGSCINLAVINDHLTLEINKTNIEDRKLNVASELLRLGTPVK